MTIDIHQVIGSEVEENPAGKKRPLSWVENKAFDSVNDLRKEFKMSWNDFFKCLKLYKNGLRYMFTAPRKLDKGLVLDHNTCMGLITLWVTNTAKNMSRVDAPPDVSVLKDICGYSGKSAIAIAAGPSAKKHDHFGLLKQYRDSIDCPIATTAHSLIPLLKAGIVPDIVEVVDGNGDKIPAFFEDDIVRQHAGDINFVACLSVHPNTMAKWSGEKKYLFRSPVPENLLPNVDSLISFMYPQYTEMDTGGNNGSALYPLLAYLGCREVAYIGLDLAYFPELPKDETMYYHAYAESVGQVYKDAQDMVSKCFEDFHHPVFDTDCYFDFVYAVFRESTFNLAKVYKQAFECQFINCTEGGSVASNDIISKPFRTFLNEQRR